MIEETKYYVDAAGMLFGYPKDGSQDAQIPVGQMLLTDEEAQAQLNPVVSVTALAAHLQAQVDAEYKRQMGIITAKYPEEERSSWYIQTAQAQAVISGAGTATPWLDACAQTRGMPREELAQRIVALDAQFQAMHGFLTGVRQWHEEALVTLAKEDEAEAREALAAYDVMQGWEPAK